MVHTYILDAAMDAFRLRLATVVSLFLNPAVFAAWVLIATLGEEFGARSGWVALLLCPGVPVLHAVYLRATGRVSAFFIPRSRDRIVPLIVAGTSSFLAGTVLFRAGAPTVPVALLFALCGLALGLAAVSTLWLVSLHAAGVTASATAMTVALPEWGVLFWVAACAVSWARIETRAHTGPQVAGGAVAGSAIYLFTHLVMTQMV